MTGLLVPGLRTDPGTHAIPGPQKLPWLRRPESFDGHRTSQLFDEHRTKHPGPRPRRRLRRRPAPAHAAPGSEADHRDYERRWWTLGVLCISLVMIVSPTRASTSPSLSDLHVSSSSLQWIVDAYGLVFAGLLLTAGSLG